MVFIGIYFVTFVVLYLLIFKLFILFQNYVFIPVNGLPFALFTLRQISFVEACYILQLHYTVLIQPCP